MKIALHEKNHGFTWQRKSPPYSFLTEDQVKLYDEEGYFLLKDAFTKDEIAQVISEIDPFEEKVTEDLRQYEDGKFLISRADDITFTTHLVLYSEFLKSFARHKVFQGLCEDLIGGDVRLYWDQAVYKKSDTQEDFPWHQDNGYTFVNPQAYLTCWIPLTDTDESNGCPWVIPKLHKKGTLKHNITELGYKIDLDAADATAVPAKAGDIVVFSSLTPHCTGPNTTPDTRKSYILQYAPDGAVRYPPFAEKEGASDPDRQFFINRKNI